MNNFRNLVEEPQRYASSPMFVAGATINQPLPIGSSIITLNTVPTNINDNGCFNPGTSTYTCQRAGRMLLLAQVTTMNLSATASICALMFVVGGADVAPKLETVPGNFTNVTFTNQLLIDVNVGTTIQLKFFNDASNNLNTRAADWGALATSLQGLYVP